MADKNMYIIAGCNGAGKTTASFTILPEIIVCKEVCQCWLNRQGTFSISTWKSIIWGRTNHAQQNERTTERKSKFRFWDYTFHQELQAKNSWSKRKGYTVTLLFFWLQNVELAKERVRIRVSEGGHSIDPYGIKRRYWKGIKNLFEIYLPIVDGALIFDNSNGEHILLAEKTVVTQHNSKEVWQFVPLQDFTSNSDIDWTKSIPEIDQQLYKKYQLSAEEVAFIESMIEPMA